MIKKFYICCRRGCPRRSLDSARIFSYLTLNGWKFTKKLKSADLILVYTCGGFQRSEDRSLLTIRHIIKRKKNGERLLITGCLIKINPEPLQDFKGVQIVDHDKLNILDALIGAETPYNKIPDSNTVPDIPDLSWGSLALRACFEEFKLSRRFARGSLDFLKSRLPGLKKAQGVFPDDVYNLKIAQGCLGHCTY